MEFGWLLFVVLCLLVVSYLFDVSVWIKCGGVGVA